MGRTSTNRAAVVAAAATAVLASGCGLQISSGDLFLLKRTGAGKTLTLLVNDGGTISCNGGAASPLPAPLLLSARDLAAQLDKDAKANLHLRGGRRSVFFYSVRLQDGTISFPDTAAAAHHELALAEQFALQAAQGPCRRSG
jgi:hypothetical protein